MKRSEITLPADYALHAALNASLFIFVFIAFALAGSNAYASGWTHTSDCTTAVAQVTLGVNGGVGVTGGAGVNPICATLLNLHLMMVGTAGKAIATIAIIALGAGALFGKITWTQALVVVLGVGLLFGAGTVMGAFGAHAALSAGNDPISAVLNVMTLTMTGNTGRGIAIFGVMILGLGALFGKISWPQALVLCTGIGLAFGSFSLVELMWSQQDNLGNALTTIFGADVQNDPLGGPFMQVVDLLTGELGKSIATAAVMALGFAAMLGKVSWDRAMLLIVGIALVFGAADVVMILRGPLSPCVQQSTDPFTQVICGFQEELQGPFGKSIATVAIIIMGILAMLGKVSWELGLVSMIGIGLIFGANELVDLFEIKMFGTTCALPPNAFVPSVPPNALADVLCQIILILYGPAGKALATIAIAMMGFGSLMGKVSYSQAFVVAVGIAIMFGAPAIVAKLMPGATMPMGCLAQITGGGGGGGGSWLTDLFHIVFGSTTVPTGMEDC